MIKKLFFVFILVTAFMLYSCSKKNHPSKNVTIAKDSVLIKRSIDSLNTAKAVARKKAKVPLPKVIEVNDSVAHKSVDGRLYYDVMGHRYWRNYQDGKYYLFNKAMYNNDAFKPK